MSFLKGIYNKLVGSKVEKIDLSSFSGMAKLFTITLSTGIKKSVFKECSVHFIDDSQQFVYFIFIENMIPTSEKDMEYYFPVSKSMNV